MLTAVSESIKSLSDILSIMVTGAMRAGRVLHPARGVYGRAFESAVNAVAHLDGILSEAGRWDPEFPKRSWLFVPGNLRVLEEMLATASEVCPVTVIEVSKNADRGEWYPYDMLQLGLRVNHLSGRVRNARARFLSTVMKLRNDWPGESAVERAASPPTCSVSI